jgi:hypothetical protein
MGVEDASKIKKSDGGDTSIADQGYRLEAAIVT